MSDKPAPLSKRQRKHLARKRKQDQDENLQQLKKQRLSETNNLNSINLEEAKPYYQNGLRKVYPYYYTYTTYCKGRWLGEPLIKVFAEEFRAHTKEEYEEFIKTGTVTVNGGQVKADYILKDSDFIANRVHRHESPVLAAPIKVIHQCDNFVVIDKPPSIPVHACGKYRHNSLMNILARENNLGELYIVHRLDRLTSGLMIFATSSKHAHKIVEEISQRKVRKQYVCRVEGNFPEEVITCNQKIDHLSHKMGVCIVSDEGKSASTEFQKLSYNGKSSVVLCKPRTGRMHQIRVHVQYLGHPILNDPIYSNQVFGPQKGKNGDYGKPKQELLQDLLKMQTTQRWLEEVHPESGKSEENSAITKCLSVYSECAKFAETMKENAFKPELLITEPNCKSCSQKCIDPRPQDLIMFLHALKYEGDGWSYSTETPVWANETWTYC